MKLEVIYPEQTLTRTVPAVLESIARILIDDDHFDGCVSDMARKIAIAIGFQL